jgi:3-isopropylmalate/(R)-2-methylmalate dehydratase large subunit
MGQTLAEKTIARAAGRARVRPGETVTCSVDLAMMHDSGGPRRVKPMLDHLGVKVWDADRVVVVSDHFVPAVDVQSAEILNLTRKWVADQGIKNFYDMQGICHVVLPERGHLLPGMFVVGGDSHSPTGGAFGCFMFGVGATDMAGIVATGETWIKVPETISIDWSGHMPRGVCAKDIMLKLCASLGMGGGDYQVIQYSGDVISSLDMQERMTLCNMAAELGAQTAIIAPDETTIDFIENLTGTRPDAQNWQGDEDACYQKVLKFDASELTPQVAAPHSPANAANVGEHAGTKITQAYIGACTGAKLNDLKMAAQVLAGRQIAPNIRLLVAPASVREMTQATSDGTLSILLEAGAILLPSGCGACAGYGAGVLGEGDVCIASTARNFQGRMGSKSSQVYLGSPYTVAASAIAGEICDPREFLAGVAQDGGAP